jgi:hypothetical protein
MAASFVALAKEADFSAPATAPVVREDKIDSIVEPPAPETPRPVSNPSASKSHRLALSYNIHVELPAVRDQAVYDAIFKALRDNLL